MKRGESVSGGLGKKMDCDDFITALGMTQAEARDAMQLASLTEEEFERMTPMIVPMIMETSRKGSRAAVRRILRQRQR